MTLADFSLSKGARRTLAPLVRVVCTDEVETLGLTDQVIDQVELTMRSIPSYLRLGLRVGRFFFEWGALVLPSTFGRRFSSLSAEKQLTYFRQWWTNPLFILRQAVKGMKSLIALGYWDLPVVRDRLAYHPERWIAEVAARRLRDYGAEVQRQDAMVLAPDPLIAPQELARKVKHDKAS